MLVCTEALTDTNAVLRRHVGAKRRPADSWNAFCLQVISDVIG